MPWLDNAKSQNNFIRLFEDSLNILSELESAQVIHRDIKPENLLFDKNSETLQLIDFDLAENSTAIVGDAGTDGFLAPETIQEKKQSHKSDVYSMGKTLESLMDNDIKDPSIKTVIDLMTLEDVTKRPGAKQLIQKYQSLRENIENQ
ncbi:kinase-like protein [Rozella allomycis CSF55]|uniref:non-specific serine/threonine protein kinase n=1 Tax=Rozella allomycis (strain CSF55) TaxID=988480 RepID=A0A4P9YCN9_ROZAC|nr:kinase-like protein [Rozella allomycis CSF55]